MYLHLSNQSKPVSATNVEGHLVERAEYFLGLHFDLEPSLIDSLGSFAGISDLLGARVETRSALTLKDIVTLVVTIKYHEGPLELLFYRNLDDRWFPFSIL